MTNPFLYKGNNGEPSLIYNAFPIPNSIIGVMKLEWELINYKLIINSCKVLLLTHSTCLKG